MRTAVLLLTLVLSGGAFVTADESSVNFDTDFDFTMVKTYRLMPGVIGTVKPEINNRLFAQRMEDAVRTALSLRGLKETAGGSDVSVSYTIAGKDYSMPARTRRTPDGPRGSGIRGTVIATGPQRFTEGTLIIDMTTGTTGELVWRGTYRDEEPSGPSLSRRLPEDAMKLLAQFPPRKR